jgi:glycosyltransferase involved in cell wall biosynthesis
MMQKKVSVCIPSYNAARFIGETIKSVLDSEYRNFEIIVSDDASTDETAKIVESLHDSRIRFYQNRRNEGPVRNWNRAITKATGEYVSLLNHDDLYSPFWLMFAVHHLEKNPHIGWVATAFRIIDGTGKTQQIISRFRTTGEIPKAEAFIETAKLDGLGPGCVIRRKILEEVGYYDEDAGPSADNDLFLRLAAMYPLYYCARYPHTSWRLHRDNLTHRYGWLEQTQDSIRMLEKIFSDPCLPSELARYKNVIFEYCVHKGKEYDEEILRHRDEEAYRKLVVILERIKNEEKGDRIPILKSM